VVGRLAFAINLGIAREGYGRAQQLHCRGGQAGGRRKLALPHAIGAMARRTAQSWYYQHDPVASSMQNPMRTQTPAAALECLVPGPVEIAHHRLAVTGIEAARAFEAGLVATSSQPSHLRHAGGRELSGFHLKCRWGDTPRVPVGTK